MPGAGLEFSKEQFAQNGDAVAPVEGDGADGENTGNGSVGAQTDQVDRNAEEGRNPDGIQGCASPGRDLDPDVGEWQQAVTCEGEDSTTEGLHRGKGDELDDDQPGNGEEHGTTFAKAVVEDLRDGLGHRRHEDLVRAAHAVAENNVEQETAEVGEEHRQRDGPRGFPLGIVDLLGDVGGRIVVGHGPAHGEETKQPAEADGLPATPRLDMGEDVGCVMLVLGHDQQSDGAGHEDAEVEDHVELGHLLHPVGRQGVDRAGDDCQGRHDTHSGAIGDGIVEVAAHGDCSQKHLGSAILRRSNTSNLTQEIEPAGQPEKKISARITNDSRGFSYQLMEATQLGGANREIVKYRPPEVGYAETSSATEHYRFDQFCLSPSEYPNTHRNAHTASTRDEPTPHDRAATTRFQRVQEGGHDGGEQTTDADREREGGQVSEFTLEHRLITELGGQLGVGLGHIGEVDLLVLAIRAHDFDLSRILMALTDLSDASNVRSVAFRHDFGRV